MIDPHETQFSGDDMSVVGLLQTMQEWVYDIDESCISEVQNMVSESVFMQDPSRMEQLVRNMAQCVVYRPDKAKCLSKLCYYLVKLTETRKNMLNIKYYLLNHILEEKNMKPGHYYFYRLCTNEGVFSKNEILASLINTNDPLGSTNLPESMQWFAPEFESEFPILFFRFIIDHQNDYKNNLIPRLSKLRADNWKLFNQITQNQQIPGTIEHSIANDDLNEFQKFTSSPGFDYNSRITPSIYDTSFFPDKQPMLINFAAYHRSINIFKYLLMNGAEINKEVEKIKLNGSNYYREKYKKMNIESINEKLIKENPYMTARFMVQLDDIQNSLEKQKEQVEILHAIKRIQREIKEHYMQEAINMDNDIEPIDIMDSTDYNQLAVEFLRKKIKNEEVEPEPEPEPKENIEYITFDFPFLGNSFPPQLNPITKEPIILMASPNTTEQVKSTPFHIIRNDPKVGRVDNPILIVDDEETQATQMIPVLPPKREIVERLLNDDDISELFAKYFPPPSPKKNVDESEIEHKRYRFGRYDDEDEEEDYEKPEIPEEITGTSKLYFTTSYAVAGGNNEILRILQQKECEFKTDLNISIIFHQNIIFSWLYNMKEKWNDPKIFQIIIENGNVDLMIYMINKHVDPNVLNKYGTTSVYLAVYRKQLDILSILLSNSNVDVNIPTKKYQDTPLFCAIRNNDIGIVKLLITKSNVDVSIQGSESGLYSYSKISPLELAVKKKSSKIVELLLSNPTVEQTIYSSSSYEKRSPFYLAMKSNDMDLIRAFVLHPKININSAPPSTPLDIAIYNNNEEAVELILNHPKININAIPSNGHAPISSSIGKYSIFSKLISYPNLVINIHITDQDPPLLIAASHKDVQYLVMLLTKPGVDINIKNKINNTALHNACATSLENVQALLQMPGIDVNARNNSGITPVMRSTNPNITKEMLSHPEIDLSICTTEGLNVLMMAIYNNCLAVFKILIDDPRVDKGLKDKKGMNILLHAARQPNLELFKLIAQRPEIDINTTDNEGMTALHHAAMTRNNAVISYLLSLPNVEQFKTDIHFRIPLHYSVQYDQIDSSYGYGYGYRYSQHLNKNDDSCFALLAKNAGNHINDIDENGFSPFLNLCKPGLKPEYLTKYPNADFSVCAKNGDNAMLYAAKYNQFEIAKEILKKEPNLLNTQDSLGNTAIHYFANHINYDALNYYVTIPGLMTQLVNKRGFKADTKGNAHRGTIINIRNILKKAIPVRFVPQPRNVQKVQAPTTQVRVAPTTQARVPPTAQTYPVQAMPNRQVIDVGATGSSAKYLIQQNTGYQGFAPINQTNTSNLTNRAHPTAKELYYQMLQEKALKNKKK